MNRQNVLDKIAKLAAMADDQGDTPEGKTAERMILKLAHKYKVESSEINKEEPFVQFDVKTGLRKRNSNLDLLHHSICDYCGVLFLIGWYYDNGKNDFCRMLSFWGYQNDIDDVRYLFNVISTQVKAMTETWYETTKKEFLATRKHKNSYALGLVVGVNKRLSNLLKGIFEYNGEKSLVPLTRPGAQIKKIEDSIKIGKVKQLKNNTDVSSFAFTQGERDSKNISIHRPIDLNTESTGLQITMVAP